MKRSLLWAALFVAAGLAGCSGNETNAPSKQAVQEADATRTAAIDNNPNLTQAQKDAMKAHMSMGRGPGR